MDRPPLADEYIMPVKRTAADIWFSKAIRQRDGWQCRICHSSFLEGAEELQCAHIYSRKSYSTRWCADNAIAACASCHWHMTNQPVDWGLWCLREFGQGFIDLLREKNNTHLKAPKPIKAEISAHYRAEYRRMQSESTNNLISWN